MESINLIPKDFIENYKDLNPELIDKILEDWQKEYYVRNQKQTIQEKAVETIRGWFNQ